MVLQHPPLIPLTLLSVIVVYLLVILVPMTVSAVVDNAKVVMDHAKIHAKRSDSNNCGREEL